MPFLTWDDALAAQAQAWSDACVFEHSRADTYGENLAIGRSLETCADAVDLWMTEPLDAGLNHATQVVWIDTTSVGCGWSPRCYMVTCVYTPPGNMVGAEWQGGDRNQW